MEIPASNVTALLVRWQDGEQGAMEALLPLVYDELRRLARSYLRKERIDHTLQPTALVHEAYMRLVDVDKVQQWNSRGHFFGAAAEAMRRVLVDHARGKSRANNSWARSREATTSSAVNALPLWNLTPLRRLKRQVRSLVCFQSVASAGCRVRS